MKKTAGTIFFIIIICGGVFAQIDDNRNTTIIKDTRIDSLVQLHVEYNKKYPIIKGYRIQILKASGNNAVDIIENSKLEFLEKHENTPIYLTFAEPDYRVRIGDFRTRLEAESFLQKIIKEYPGAWVIQDDIHFPKLPN